MKEIQLLLKAVTPIFLYGAPSNYPELRGAPFRGQLRYWYRTIHPDLSAEELAKVESRIFGSTEVGSRVTISIMPRETPIISRQVLPHREDHRFQQPAFEEENSRFRLTGRVLSDEAFEPFIKSLLLFLNLGGIGKRARRGFGSLKVIGAEFLEGTSQGENLLAETAFRGYEDLNDHIASVLSYALPGHIQSSSDMSAFPDEADTANYPSFANNSWCVLVCRETLQESDPPHEHTMEDFWRNHLRRYGIRDDDAFGYARHGRRASPFHLHITEAEDGYHLILTAFNAYPKPTKNFWEKHKLLFDSCLNAYGGTLYSSQEGGNHDA